MVQPVLQDSGALRREDGLRVELYAAHVVRAVAKGHDVAVVADGRDLQTVGQTAPADHPRVVAPSFKGFGQVLKQVVVVDDVGRCLYAVVHGSQVFEPSAEHLGNGLMAQTDAQYGLAPGVAADDVVEQAGLFRNTGARREYDFVVRLQSGHLERIVAHHVYLRAQRLELVAQVVGKRVVIVNNYNIHVLQCIFGLDIEVIR